MLKVKSNTQEEGFTLLEMVVVIGIIVILSAATIPIFLNARTSAIKELVSPSVVALSEQQEAYTVAHPGSMGAKDISNLNSGKLPREESVLISTFTTPNVGYCVVGHVKQGKKRTTLKEKSLNSYLVYDSKLDRVMLANDSAIKSENGACQGFEIDTNLTWISN